MVPILLILFVFIIRGFQISSVNHIFRDSLMNLRKKLCMRTTTMNFQGNAVLRKLLPGLELSHGGLSSEHKLPNADHLSELQRIVTSHKVCKLFIGCNYVQLNVFILPLLNTQWIISKTFSRFVAFLFILLSPTWIH